jgi:hypothetical protein
MGYQVKFHPNDNNVFLMAASDNKIYQVTPLSPLLSHR